MSKIPVKRINLAIPELYYKPLEDYARKQSINITQAIKKGIRLLVMIDHHMEQGGHLVLTDKDGRVIKELLVL